MRTWSLGLIAASTLALSGSGLYAQSVISAHSGVLHYYEGDVTIDGQAPHQKPGTFADVKQKQELQTQIGRAEVLLTPGVFLRLGENTGIRMDSNKLSDTQVAFLKGSALVDFVDVTKDNSVKVSYQDYQVAFTRKGVYRFDSDPAEIKVYSGEAVVTHGGTTVNLKDGRMVTFTPALASEKFDNRTGDELYRWARRRSEYISVANLSAARQMGSGYNTGYNTIGTAMPMGGWYFNPYYSMFTYVPGSGILCDPFAMYACYYSPLTAWRYYNNYPYYGYNYGGGGGYYSYPTNRGYSSAGYYPTSVASTRTLSAISAERSAGVSPGVSHGSSSSIGGFSGVAASSGIGGFSAPGAAPSHGGGSAGGHGR